MYTIIYDMYNGFRRCFHQAFLVARQFFILAVQQADLFLILEYNHVQQHFLGSLVGLRRNHARLETSGRFTPCG